MTDGVNIEALAAAAGATTGEIITTVAFYPLELMKCRLQSQVVGGGSCAYHYSGVMDGISTVLREEGVGGLFAGLQTVMVRAIACDFATVYFGELFLGLYRRKTGSVDGWSAVPMRVLGGWVSILMTLPLEIVTTRIMCTSPPLTAGAAVRKLWKQGGLTAFWCGLKVSFILCLNPALMLTAVEQLRAIVLRLRRSRGREASDRPQMSWLECLSVGAVAKLTTLSAVYPLIRAKVLLQARDTKGANLAMILRFVLLQEGIRGLYRGLGAQLSKALLSASLKYAVKERTEGRWQAALLQRRGAG